ncbi:acyltransferase [Isoptericola sp. b441]|uniref:Acyltransferase n=1 Tax=Actinotalea lenta TaxID=3064654 RepID=A0ABT9DCB0_9CELL|nr:MULTISPECIES: acyltransferase [unclassified Isoptericola]MDO8108543.1 acyltransferase [Isoptericola sp. b441]MDO8119953.1 acyltransferase [Isoptericola sp. b490]
MITTAVATGSEWTGRVPPPSAGTPSRLRALDGLRFLAAAGVLLYHFTARSPEWGSGVRFPVLGNVAIYLSLAPELFFVISGFVILWTAWDRPVANVIASRVARIYPAYWAALALTSLLLGTWWTSVRQLSAGQVAVNATLLQSVFGVSPVDGVYWTLWAELRFYLLVVVLAAVGLSRRRVLAFSTAWPVLAVLAEHTSAEPWATLLIGGYAPFFAAGMALFLIWRDGHSWWPWAIVAGNAALGAATAGVGRATMLARLTPFQPSTALVCAVAVACVAAVAAVTLTPARRWDWRGLTAVGALTYPLYLVHQYWGRFVIQALHDHLPRYVTLAVAAAVSVLIALAVHRGVERVLHRPVRRAVQRGLTAMADRLSRAGAQPRPPTDPGSSVPSATAFQKAGVLSGSSSTVDPTPPGR